MGGKKVDETDYGEGTKARRQEQQRWNLYGAAGGRLDRPDKSLGHQRLSKRKDRLCSKKDIIDCWSVGRSVC